MREFLHLDQAQMSEIEIPGIQNPSKSEKMIFQRSEASLSKDFNRNSLGK
jgi:hypothetical protein